MSDRRPWTALDWGIVLTWTAWLVFVLGFVTVKIVEACRQPVAVKESR